MHLLLQNIHIENGNYGIFITGNAAPSIVDCYIHDNGIAGIYCSGSSSPTINWNVIVNNGYGVSTTDNSIPIVNFNDIFNNSDPLDTHAQRIAAVVLRRDLHTLQHLRMDHTTPH